ncbi:MAG TPA: ATP-binding protein [Candidatus Polarisedimenticolia bacterium]|jgi:signal transduction histidine kinase|nr:ATP-binding protein [Candidatus Polarisedimenticolia bacterium]
MRNAADRERVSRGEWLVGGGEMAKTIKAKDWSKTPLGPMDSWPQSLRTTVSLVQASNSPISLAWGPGHVQIYNDGYWPICGAKHPASMGQDFRECWASAFPVIGEAYATAWSGKSAYLEKMRMFLDRYGFLEETWFTFSFSPITDESGSVGGLFHPVTEMTSQMLTERRTKTLRELASRGARARTTEEAFALSAQVLAESDLDLPFVLFYLVEWDSRRARLIGQTGLEPGTDVSPKLIDLRSPVNRPWPVEEVTRTGLPCRIDSTGTLLAGRPVGPYPEIPKSAFALPIRQPGTDQPAAVMVAGVSSRLPMNEPYRGFYDLIGAAVGTALANARAYEVERKRAEALAEIDRAKTAFFSNVSHEFRTPITLILAPLEDELAERRDPLPAGRRERLETAHRNSLRLLKLVNTLLDFSRIEAGRIQATYEPTHLGEETAELASAFRSAVERAGLQLTVDCPPLPEPVYVDRQMWEKIVLNLVSNAFKHTFQGGIEIKLRWRENGAELSVHDTGVGIATEELPRIFERFHRVKGAQSRSHEGTGIGLALVKELVLQHGGEVRVESQEGKGSVFTVAIKAGRAHLPAERLQTDPRPASPGTGAAAYVEEALHWLPGAPAEIAMPSAGARPGAAPGQSAAAASQHRSSVLWADDNTDMREYVRRLLSQDYDVIAVADGVSALEMAKKQRPDIVLTDVMMPRLDGFGLLRELRADPSMRTVPVILLSARAGEEATLEGLQSGADDYLVKPFSARELQARVRTHLDMSRARLEWARRLEQANQELEAFSYSISHDLRTPLRHIQGFVELLREEAASALDENGSRYLGKIDASAKSMAKMIEDLLAFSHMGRREMRDTRVDMGRLVSEVKSELQEEARGRRIVWNIGPMPEVRGDAALLKLAVTNLLANAMKYTQNCEEARIEIASEAPRNEVVISVRDNGVGFDPRYAHRLFGVFQRLHETKEFEGTGIGLANVRRIVSRHGGRTWAHGEVGRGAAFFFSLPKAWDEEEGPAAADRLSEDLAGA